MAGCMQFHVRTEHEGRVRRLTPVGELDIATAGELRGAFEAVLGDADAEAEVIVVDLGELTFMDSTGLHALLAMSAACEHGDRLRVVNASGSVARLFDIAGVGDRLPVMRPDDDPLAPLPRRGST